MAEPTVVQRKMLAKMGIAMPDGSYYIRNEAELSDAIKAVGRATPNAGESDVQRRNDVRQHCIARAKALMLTKMIPDTWNSDGSLKQSISVDDILEHFGVKGMHWGIRKTSESNPADTKTSAIKGLDKFPPDQAAAYASTAAKMSKAYGFQVKEFVPLTSRESKNGLAYISMNSNGGVIHASTESNLKSTLLQKEREGWFPDSSGHSMEALITHESAHAMFHTLGKGSDSWKGFNNQKQPTGKILKEAWKKAAAQAVADGIIKPQKTGFSRILDSSPEFKLAKFISRYADTSVFREESEAEIFRAYHWSSNPSKFIDAFMKELNDGLGVDAPPFSGRKIK